MDYEEGRGSPREVREQIGNIAELVAQPEFSALVQEILDTPEENRPEVAQRLATVSEFRRRGLSLPEGLRVTLRVFENPDDPTAFATSIVDERDPETRQSFADFRAVSALSVCEIGRASCRESV